MRGGRRAAAHAPPTPQGRNGIADHLLGPQETRGPAPTMQPPPAPPRPSLSPPILEMSSCQRKDCDAKKFM